MKKLLLIILLLCAIPAVATSYFSDRAVGVSPFGSILGLVPIQYGQVRVCDLPLTQVAPCLPLAPITGVPGFPVDTSGSRFGQITTAVTGQFTFGCAADSNLQIQVASQSSNTPQLSYPVTCGGASAAIIQFHNLLSTTHLDTNPTSPPAVGDLVYGGPVGNPPVGLWNTLGIGVRYEALTVGAKVLGFSSPEWGQIHLDQPVAVTGILPVPNGGTGVNTLTNHGVLIGQVAAPVHITTAGNAAECLTSNGAGADPTFQPCPGGSNPCEIGQVTNWYVATTGNDGTGDGTIGLPWRTIQHAVDQLPGIVCGRYVINLAAGTYNENVTAGVKIAGRVFAGGNEGSDPTLVQWPINDGNYGTLAYSWVQILGDPTSLVTSNYVIQNSGGGNVIAVAGGNLTLQGVTIDGGDFGLHTALGAFVNLNGVQFLNATGTSIMATEGSTIHVDCCDYVDGGASSVLITDSNGFDGIELADGSLLTDFQSDGNNTDTSAIVTVTPGTGALTGQCIELKDSHIYFRGDINCTMSAATFGLRALNSQMRIQTLNIDGQSLATTRCVGLDASELSGAVFGGANFSISNCATGVLTDYASLIDFGAITFSANTVNWNFGGISSNPQVSSGAVNGRASELLETVTFSATPIFNMTKGAIKKITLTADVTSSTITNPPNSTGVAEFLTLIICQDGAGNRTFAFPANVPSPGTIAATASKCNVQRFIYDVAAAKWWSLSAMVTGQ